MRVIAGSRRSIPLATLPDKTVRPTTDRIKETLFNMLSNRVPGSRFLDLFAGSGQIGIEALSRGAAFAVFVDVDRRAARCIGENLKKTKFEEDAEILQKDWRRAVASLAGGEGFDIVFLDPPYAMEGQQELLLALAREGLLAEGGLVVLEADRKTSFDESAILPLKISREKVYKTNKHIFFEMT